MRAKRLPGCCIYCGSLGDPDLQMEHVIPESLGGKIKFPKASCRECAEKTSAFEGRVVSRLYGDSRALLGMRRGKGRKWPDTFQVYTKPATDRTRSILTLSEKRDSYLPQQVSSAQLPGAIFLVKLPLAGIVRGVQLDDKNFPIESFSVASATPDMIDRLRQFRSEVLLGGGLNTEDFARFLAKIAHSYAAAVLGIGTFIPFLTKAIRGERPMYLSHYVGCSTPAVPIQPTDHLHVLQEGLCEISGGRRLVFVRVRLFAAPKIFPAYDVAVGEATRATPLS
jgi:hypothetical protein